MQQETRTGSRGLSSGRGHEMNELKVASVSNLFRYINIAFACCFQNRITFFRTSTGGRVTNAVGTIFRKIFVGTRIHPI